MGLDIGPIVKIGLNATLTAIVKAIPGGSPALAAGCDGGELACKMGLVVLPKLRDGQLEDGEIDEIVAEFTKNVPAATAAIAVSALRSMVDRVMGGVAKL